MYNIYIYVVPRLNYALGKCYSRENSIKRSRVPLLRYHFSSEESDFVSSNFLNSIVKIRLPVPPLISRDPPAPGRESARFRAKEKIFFLEKRMERNIDSMVERGRSLWAYSYSRNVFVLPSIGGEKKGKEEIPRSPRRFQRALDI